MGNKISVGYTPAYQEQCFQAWYLAGRPKKNTEILDVIPLDEHQRKPIASVIGKWRDELGWDWRADDLDAQAASQSDDILISAKVLMVKEQAARARQIQEMGMAHLQEHGFDTASAAVSAIVRGATLERESRGLEIMLQKVAGMTDGELLKAIKDAQAALSAGQLSQIIDVSEVEEKKEPNNEDDPE